MELATDSYEYFGDVNLEYGGIFFDLSEYKYGYVSAVRVTDLDSGCGFSGAVMVEHITILGFDDAKRVAESLKCTGQLMDRALIVPVDESDRETILIIAESLASYGHYDSDDSWDNYATHHTEIIQCDPDGEMEYDGWKADHRLSEDETIEEYVIENHLRNGNFERNAQ